MIFLKGKTELYSCGTTHRPSVCRFGLTENYIEKESHNFFYIYEPYKHIPTEKKKRIYHIKRNVQYHAI